MKKKEKFDPAETVCETCRHAKPVTHEHRTHDGRAIFCTCEYVPAYHFLRHNVTHRNCEYYDEM